MKWSGEVGLIVSLGINLYEGLVRFSDLSQVRRGCLFYSMALWGLLTVGTRAWRYIACDVRCM